MLSDDVIMMEQAQVCFGKISADASGRGLTNGFSRTRRVPPVLLQTSNNCPTHEAKPASRALRSPRSSFITPINAIWRPRSNMSAQRKEPATEKSGNWRGTL